MSEYMPSEQPAAEEPAAGDQEGQLEAEAWAGPSQEEWQSLTAYQQATMPIMQELAQILSSPDDTYAQQPQYGQQPYGQPAEDDFDPYDQNQLQGLIQQHLNQALEPLQGIVGMVASDKGEQLAKSELETIQNELGAFDTDTAFLVASGLIEAGHDPAQALRHAASYAQSYEAKIRADERAKVQQEYQNVSQAPNELPVGGSALQGVGTPTGSDRYEVAIARALANNHPSLPTG